MQPEYTILILFLFLMGVSSLAVVLSKSILSSVIMQSVFSLFAVLAYSILRAPDVAITEVAVGAAVSTLFALLVIAQVEKRTESYVALAIPSANVDYWWTFRFGVSICFFVGITSFVANLHDFGAAESFVSKGVDALYLSRTMRDFGIEEVVTAILGGYRGFDTLIETTVGFAAAFGVRQILKKKDNF